MKLVVLGLGALVAGVLAMPLLATPASAEAPGASATATAHALDELANAIAQGKIARTPTPSPTATVTPAPMPTLQPTAAPTDPPAATSTPAPALPVPAADADPLGGYVRPSTIDPGELELALPQGRWEIRLDTPACVPFQPWTNVWLAPGVQPPLLVARGGVQDGALCGIAETAWHADVPCAQLGPDQCDFEADAVYWASVEEQAVAQVADTPTPVPPTPAPTRAPVPVLNVPVRLAAPPTPAPQARVVVQTVVVIATAAPTDTPIPDPTTTPRPTLTTSPPPTATVATVSAAATAPPLLGLRAGPSPTEATAAARAAERVEPRGSSNWLFMLAIGCVVLMAGAAWFARGKRRYVL